MIKRGPNPQGNFQILPNSTARDKRLSYRARGLLALMLSYPEDFRFNRDWLARQSEQDGVTAVRTALTELEKAGYLVRRKVRINGRFGWEQILYREAQTAGESRGGLTADGIPAAGDPPCKEDGHEDSQEDSETDMGPRSQARAAATNSEPEIAEEPSWREQDRDLFRQLVGDQLLSDGTGSWGKGVWSADAFYLAYRKKEKKWPGRWLQQIADRDGLEYWLLDEGLEAVAGGRN